MKINRVKIALNNNAAFLIVMLLLSCSSIFAQKTDTSKFSVRPKAKAFSRIPVIKGSVQPYKPSYNIYSSTDAHAKSSVKEKSGKTLTVLKIYPNPAFETLNLELNELKDEEVGILIFNEIGQIVLRENVVPGDSLKKIDVSALQSGLYMLEVKSKSKIVRYKVVKI